MAVPSPAGRRWTVAALLALTVATGLVDALCYLRLGHVFAANMTGNVVFLGFSIEPDSGIDAPASVVAIAGFVLGALAGGRLATAIDGRSDVWLMVACGTEALLLAVVAVLTGLGVLDTAAGVGRLVAVLLLAMAFGVQNATVRRLGAPDLTTTVLTLTITGVAADSILAGGPGAKPHRRLGSVLAMLVGAGIGALLLHVTFAGVLWLAVLIVLAAGAVFGTRLGGAVASP